MTTGEEVGYPENTDGQGMCAPIEINRLANCIIFRTGMDWLAWYKDLKHATLEALIQDFQRTGQLPFNPKFNLVCVDKGTHYEWWGLLLMAAMSRKQILNIIGNSHKVNEELSATLKQNEYVMGAHAISMQTGQVENHMY